MSRAWGVMCLGGENKDAYIEQLTATPLVLVMRDNGTYLFGFVHMEQT